MLQGDGPPTLHAKQSFQSNKTHRKHCEVLTTYQNFILLKNFENKSLSFIWAAGLPLKRGKVFFLLTNHIDHMIQSEQLKSFVWADHVVCEEKKEFTSFLVVAQ